MRLLSLAPSNTEILYSLGLGDQIVGVTGFCDYPEDAKSKPRLGGWTTPIVERIAQLSPDFIFTSYFLPPELKGWKGPGEIIHVAPKTLSQVYQSIKKIGKVTQRKEAAEELVSRMKTNMLKIERQVSRHSGKRSASRISKRERSWTSPSTMSSGPNGQDDESNETMKQ